MQIQKIGIIVISVGLLAAGCSKGDGTAQMGGIEPTPLTADAASQVLTGGIAPQGWVPFEGLGGQASNSTETMSDENPVSTVPAGGSAPAGQVAGESTDGPPDAPSAQPEETNAPAPNPAPPDVPASNFVETENSPTTQDQLTPPAGGDQ